MARMPELSLSETSARLKPSRLSISSWLRMRSAPPLADCKLAAIVDHRRPLRGRIIGAGVGSGRVRACRSGAGVRFQRQPPFGGERVLVDLVFVAIA